MEEKEGERERGRRTGGEGARRNGRKRVMRK